MPPDAKSETVKRGLTKIGGLAVHSSPMYLVVDVGGTKTLVAIFNEHGLPIRKHELATHKKYDKFLKQLAAAVKQLAADNELTAAAAAIPGHIDRRRGLGVNFGNLDWLNVPVRDDLRRIMGDKPAFVENDGNLGGLSEALLVRDRYTKVLYITIGTGVGKGFTNGGKIVPELADGEPGHMLLEVGGRLVKWESLVSGHALFERYGKKASQIDDLKIWQEYAHYLALGLDELLAILQPEAVIIGGGVGSHYEKFAGPLNDELKKFENDMVDIPPILQAKHPEEAVIYGCYDYIRQQNL